MLKTRLDNHYRLSEKYLRKTMSYIVTFISGRTKVISDETERSIHEIGLEGRGDKDGSLLHCLEGKINYDQIESVYLLQEAKSGITGTPTPDDLRTQKTKDREELLGNPKMLIQRAVEKDE
jgi:hypothetical protein